MRSGVLVAMKAFQEETSGIILDEMEFGYKDNVMEHFVIRNGSTLLRGAPVPFARSRFI